MNNFDKLVHIWCAQDSNADLSNDAQLIERIQNDYQYQRRQLIWLSIREAVPCFFLSAMTLAVGWTNERGSWAFIASSVLFFAVAIFLVTVTICLHLSQPLCTETIRQSLQRSLVHSRRCEWLYRNIVWWYLFPIFFAWGAIVAQEMLPDGINVWTALYISFGLLFFLFVGWLNRRIAIKQFRPMSLRFERMLEHLNEMEQLQK